MLEKRATITDVALRKLKPNGSRYEITDSIAVGLRIRVSAEGRITFILKARDAASKLQTVTLGQFCLSPRLVHLFRRGQLRGGYRHS